jgi:hypothetical protein
MPVHPQQKHASGTNIISSSKHQRQASAASMSSKHEQQTPVVSFNHNGSQNFNHRHGNQWHCF